MKLKVSAAIVIFVLVFEAFACLAAQTPVDCNFDDYGIDELPNPPFDCRETNTGRVRVEEDDNGKYVKISCEGIKGDQGFMQYVPKNAMEGMFYTEFDFNLDSRDAKIAMPEIRDNPNKKTTSFFTVNTDGTITVGDETIMEYQPGEWYHAKVCANLAERKYSVWMSKRGEKAEKFDGSITAQLMNVEFVRFPVYGANVTEGKTAGMYLDNIVIRMDDEITLIESSPVQGAADVVPGDRVKLQFNSKPETVSFTLNGIPVKETEFTVEEDGSVVFEFENLLQWETEYILRGTAVDAYGNTCAANLNFTLRVQPDYWIETLGFYDENGERLSEIKSGEITVRMRFWQLQPVCYTYTAGLYKQDSQAIEMLGAVCKEKQAETGMFEEELTINVPENCENCFIRTFVWNEASQRVPYGKQFYYGNGTLD